MDIIYGFGPYVPGSSPGEGTNLNPAQLGF